ncbi:CoA-acylating methylmalonate-semialdehyde dehydrogenase [Actinotalea sp. M2MS4P-6]|uniref:CoA-acylating methylmalonate-semialdehyde dehydrogenase n=1 Tax=Actinotalea sp. M2MS4P-6 TaxID=2983762 RepID=UPI0021E46553|nr:CoA-acylating methylmalonate-semialdehyde dehydrogenase [Actinotalea sp. M2MS4P-6]MCV2395028.1 CoA-acylating methylmalonate-semialdehyde dehydrogenase [Actinotalea sp. M2MS4P-6]
MTSLTANWMDGEPYEGHYEKTSPLENPATGEVIGEVVHATPEDVEAIIASAKKASETWSQVSLAKRTAILFRFRELLVEHTDEIAEIVVREHGKVFSDAKGEVGRGLEVAEFACSIPTLLKGEFSDQAATGIDVYSFRQPVGVVAGITPFNFPVMIPLWMSPVAIATGNAFILKPPTRDPGAGMLLAKLWKKAGLPDGVFNVVHGDRSVISRLLTHPDIDAISFVGATTTAKIIFETGTKHGKRVQALGAAKNHGLVLADADLESTANNLIAAAYGAAGERCMALPVAVVQEEIADELVAKLVEKAKAVKVAEGMTPDADMGAIITKDAVERITGLITSAEEEGAEILVDGRNFTVEGYEGGNWLGPTLIDKVRPGMRVNQEELFGPTLEIIRVSGLEEGLALINGHEFGNGSAIFTSSGEAARTFTRGVEAGMVGVNVPIPVPVAWHSFGGWKESLVGETHIYGPEGVKFYTRGKVITQRWPRTTGGVSFHFSGDAQK